MMTRESKRTIRVDENGDEYCSCGGYVWDVGTFARCGHCRTIFRDKRGVKNGADPKPEGKAGNDVKPSSPAKTGGTCGKGRVTKAKERR